MELRHGRVGREGNEEGVLTGTGTDHENAHSAYSSVALASA